MHGQKTTSKSLIPLRNNLSLDSHINYWTGSSCHSNKAYCLYGCGVYAVNIKYPLPVYFYYYIWVIIHMNWETWIIRFSWIFAPSTVVKSCLAIFGMIQENMFLRALLLRFFRGRVTPDPLKSSRLRRLNSSSHLKFRFASKSRKDRAFWRWDRAL